MLLKWYDFLISFHFFKLLRVLTATLQVAMPYKWVVAHMVILLRLWPNNHYDHVKWKLLIACSEQTKAMGEGIWAKRDVYTSEEIMFPLKISVVKSTYHSNFDVLKYFTKAPHKSNLLHHFLRPLLVVADEEEKEERVFITKCSVITMLLQRQLKRLTRRRKMLIKMILKYLFAAEGRRGNGKWAFPFELLKITHNLIMKK